MSLGKGNKALWSDVAALYSAMNTQRKRFLYSEVAVPSETGTAMVPTDVSDLKA